MPAGNTTPAPKLPNASNFCAATRKWWETWATSPQASRFVGTDWQRLVMLAPLVNRYFGMPDAKLLVEIRLNESLLGATVVDRLRLRWDVNPDEPETPVSGAQEADRRRQRVQVAMRLIDGDKGA